MGCVSSTTYQNTKDELMAEDNSAYLRKLAKRRDERRKRQEALGDRRCKNCNEPIHGRIGKVFCSQRCSDHYRYYENVEETRSRNREAARNAARKRTQKDEQKISDYQHRYYDEHREEKKSYAARYRREHPEASRAIKHKRRAQCAKGPNHTRYDELKLYNRVHGECAYCGRHVEFKDGQFDHRIPLSKGGNNGIGNIEWTCAHCNMSKKDKFLSEWLHREDK